MSLYDAIQSFNETEQPKIELRPTRDGRVGAFLPRIGKEALVEGSDFKEDVKVTAADLALVCAEARQAMTPALALLDAALAALAELDKPAS